MIHFGDEEKIYIEPFQQQTIFDRYSNNYVKEFYTDELISGKIKGFPPMFVYDFYKNGEAQRSFWTNTLNPIANCRRLEEYTRDRVIDATVSKYDTYNYLVYGIEKTVNVPTIIHMSCENGIQWTAKLSNIGKRKWWHSKHEKR